MTSSATVEHIADQVMALQPSERARLVDWFFDLELGHDSWDEQIAKDSQPGGRLEGILSKVRRDIEAKQTLPLDEFLDNA
ncbi:hypothetical protein [Desulfonatronum lacustre]|uniref:hypothetical protein n=1 Tax=Desulfonatronum lacustre TaxID=66849 RepID=UPI00048F0ECF|nr:hypothetical protein [Desulfonatronum lacustre]SMP72072.1 hypothetical protein SAMN06295888_11872 [Desulfonatronum zhilinae]